jgi:hypothetical protein
VVEVGNPCEEATEEEDEPGNAVVAGVKEVKGRSVLLVEAGAALGGGGCCLWSSFRASTNPRA